MPSSEGATCLPWVSTMSRGTVRRDGGGFLLAVSLETHLEELQLLLETLHSEVSFWTKELFSLECLTPERMSRA